MSEQYSLINKSTLRAIADGIRYIEDSSDNIPVREYADRLFASKQATYGVRFYGSATNGTRLYDAVGKQSGINGATNDFDEMPIFKDIQPIYLSAKNSSGGVLKDSNGQDIKNKLIKIPNFYVKHILDTDADGNVYDEWRISTEGNRADWYPVFVNDDGTLPQYALVGAYFTTYLDNQSLLGCQKGQNPRVNIGQNNVNSSMCYVGNENGVPFQKLNGTEDGTIWSALSILFMIEFATRNTQSIMNGVVSDEYREICKSSNSESAYNTANSTTSTITLLANQGCISGKTVGDTIQIYNGRWNTRKITNIDSESISGYKVLTLDREITLNSNPYVSYAWAESVGTTDDIASSSGRNLYQNSSKAHFKYRGVEDMWGNIWHINSGYYFHSDGTDEVLYKSTAKYNGTASGTSTNCVIAKGNGYAKVVEMTKDNKGVMLYTKEIGGASNTYYCDYFYQNVATNNYCLLFGGVAYFGSYCGSFYFNCSAGFTFAGWNCGLRPSLFVG